MKIAIYGAGGMVGSRIAAEAVDRGHDVIGVTRSGGVLPGGVRALRGSATDPSITKAVADEADAVVCAIGPDDYLDAIATLATTVGRKRLLLVGGAGSLIVDGQRVVDSPDFPPQYQAGALIIAQGLDYLRELGDGIEWTMLSPAKEMAPGERTGTFRLGLDAPVGDRISAEDYAVALVDEIEHPVHYRRRFTLGY
ncbi:NAD(P)-dependent oxidoreductase [Planotetraspora kaengkrachanensis]|uniref:Putative epimerase/dehydratase n=1 Tax=Planotetraspora kaengkrachanensis TaxID=575193 RepID=A0A8J3M4L2_9ACTN|nr:NAD(P)H-binding protein [Planotetraspora kaengkrachanensis]GIG79041.1 putative epimerase/dehydratase [Planotetraspora kaengkrachanensis]